MACLCSGTSTFSLVCLTLAHIPSDLENFTWACNRNLLTGAHCCADYFTSCTMLCGRPNDIWMVWANRYAIYSLWQVPIDESQKTPLGIWSKKFYLKFHLKKTIFSLRDSSWTLIGPEWKLNLKMCHLVNLLKCGQRSSSWAKFLLSCQVIK